MITCFHHPQLLKNHKIISEDLWISDGKIIPPQDQAHLTIDARELIIAPGYIDLQINGGFNCDFSSNPEKVEQVAKLLPQYGVTSFLPTIISSLSKQYPQLLSTLQPKRGLPGAEILGVHLEGPFLNPLNAGAHSTEFFRECQEFSHPEEFYGNLDGVKMVTLAPELPGALEWISTLASQNIVVSAGHSSATLEQMYQAMERGVSMATHLFNAMTPFYHRSPGIIGAVLGTQGFFYSIIADGFHLHPLTVDLIWRCQPQGLILISDAMASLGSEKEAFSLGSKKVEIRQDQGYIQGTEVLAGSVQSLDAAVRNLHQFTNCTLVEALEAASLKPAQVLGLKHKGTLDIGADADLVILDDSLNVQACYVKGECLYKSHSSISL